MTGTSDTSLPSSASSNSTRTCWPSATFSCLPPEAITAYIAGDDASGRIVDLNPQRPPERRMSARGLPRGRTCSSLEQAVVDGDAATLTFRALLRVLPQQPLTDALARHLHESEFGDVEDLRPGLVAGQRVAEQLDDLGTVLADLHVDEVDDDDAADVAQAQLLGDLLGRLHVVVEDGLLEARRADVLAGVDVDDGEGLGVLDDQRPARRQPDLAVERLVDLLVHVELLEQAEPLGLPV